MARPKADATRIKELETALKYAEIERDKVAGDLDESMLRNSAMAELFYDMHFILSDIHSRQDACDETGPFIHALMLMAEKGTEA